jgi:hypothetical protein
MRKLNILVIDPLEPKGHIMFNGALINILKLIGNVTFAGSKKYITNFDCNHIYINHTRNKKNKLSYRIDCLLKLFKIKKEIEFDLYDIVIISSFETISFSIFSTFIQEKIYLVNHNNLDELRSSVTKRLFYKSISKNITMWCLERYFCDYVEGLTNMNTLYIPHPLNKKQNNQSPQYEKKNKILFAPSGSSDKEWILRIFNEEKDFLFYAKCNEEKSNEHNKLITYFESYNEILLSADCIFLPLNFDYRVSGPFIEAMSLGKPIIMTKSKYAIEMQKLYPRVIRIIEHSSEISKMFNELTNIDKEERDIDFSAFYSKHSDINISNSIKEAIGVSR